MHGSPLSEHLPCFPWLRDKDYAAESSGLNIHPHLGTVTYFSSHGGPTMVLEHAGPLQKADSCALADIAQGWLSVPKLGKVTRRTVTDSTPMSCHRAGCNHDPPGPPRSTWLSTAGISTGRAAMWPG